LLKHFTEAGLIDKTVLLVESWPTVGRKVDDDRGSLSQLQKDLDPLTRLPDDALRQQQEPSAKSRHNGTQPQELYAQLHGIARERSLSA
jgi:hypothetical protein